jgi:aldehyde:ferredoxin oxidoreductase
MLHKLTRVDLIEAHGVLSDVVMDRDVEPFIDTSPAAWEINERAAALGAILAAVSDYAMIVVDDTFAHLGFHSIYARNYVGAIREASEALNQLLMAHAAKLGDRGQPDDAA